MDKIRALFVFAGQGLWAKPFQSILMTLTFGIVFAASLLALSGIRSGYYELEKSLKRLGRDLVQVHKNPALNFLLDVKLTESDVKICSDATNGVASGAHAVSAVAAAEKNERDGAGGVSAVLLGTDRMWPVLNCSTYLHGRFFKQDEADSCALDVWVARELFGRTDVVGATFTVRWGGEKRELTVRGVLEDPFSIRDRLQRLDVLHGSRPLEFRLLEGRNIYVPFSVFKNTESILFCLIRPAEGMNPYEATRRIRQAFGERAGRLLVWARGPWIDSILEAVDIGFVFSHTVWGIFLSLAGAMIMTISLLAVSDRSVEIGIRRTQGATRAAICVQVLLEGFIISSVGAAAGFAAAPFVGAWIERHMLWKLTIQPGSIAFVAAAGVVVTLISFLLPAYRASRLEPVDVLREL